tara:strand:+ start:2018 stop:2500 length:483 start_codon:yes stop_codon:yes gene_type:complete
MVKRKPITQLIPDVREALIEGMEEATEAITLDLIEQGPYWSGLFARSWMVVRGQNSIPQYIPRQYPVPREARERPKGEAVKALRPIVPKNEDLRGYTIGNMTEYAGYAMDIWPTNKGRQGGNAPNATAPPKWFQTYAGGGTGTGMAWRVEHELTNVFRRY